jgi:hypothetical protein
VRGRQPAFYKYKGKLLFPITSLFISIIFTPGSHRKSPTVLNWVGYILSLVIVFGRWLGWRLVGHIWVAGLRLTKPPQTPWLS